MTKLNHEVDGKKDVNPSNKLGDILSVYEKVLNGTSIDDVLGSIPILQSPDINVFLQGSIKFENNRLYNSAGYEEASIGGFISRLIQKSYDAGNNDFVLSTKGLPDIHCLGTGLKGSSDRPLVLRIDGNAGHGCCHKAEAVSVCVQGNVENYCGSDSEGSSFFVQGNAGIGFGYGSKGSSFSFQGNVNDSVMGGRHSKGSSYSASSKEVYSRLNGIVPYGNRVFLVDANGKVLKESLFRRVLNVFIR